MTMTFAENVIAAGYLLAVHEADREVRAASGRLGMARRYGWDISKVMRLENELLAARSRLAAAKALTAGQTGACIA